ncbi:putative tyrosine-protein phosphatase cdc-14 [Diplonema papillatum]|nr:putative tyrosine-protein phosphatase cdc-14 [Diplonema papillatum]
MTVANDAAEPAAASIPGRACPIIQDRLYFLSVRGHPKSDSEHYYWTADHDLVYEPFEADFGPLKLSMLVRFCRASHRNLMNPDLAAKKLFVYSSHNGHKRTNAAYLVAGFCILVLNETPEVAWAKLKGTYPPFLPFRDVSCGVSTFNCTLFHCLQGLHRAKELGWIDWKRFDIDEYELAEQPANGDWNWIIPPEFPPSDSPGKLIAFCTPVARKPGELDGSGVGFRYYTPEDYCRLFRERGVTGVVRLCKRMYDRKTFTENGFKHVDLIFPDGATPPDSVVSQFLKFVESNKGAVAVHCRAGLGRTGTLIGCYLMKHHGFTAASAIAWMRVCRPGSVIGPQQQFLVGIEHRLRPSPAPPLAGAPAASRPRAPLHPSPTKKHPKQSPGRRSQAPVSAAAPADSPAPSSAAAARADPGTSALLQRSRAMQIEIDEILEKAAISRPQTAQAFVEPPPSVHFANDPGTPPRAPLQMLFEPATPLPDAAIDKKTLKDLRALIVPPPVVKRTIFTMMRVLEYKDLNWSSVREKLGSSEMIARFQETKTRIEADPERYLKKVESYINDPSCRPAVVGKASKEARDVCCYLHALASVCRCSLMASSSPKQQLPPLRDPLAPAKLDATFPMAPVGTPPGAFQSAYRDKPSRLARPPATLIFKPYVT